MANSISRDTAPTASSTSLASRSLATVSWYLIELACFSARFHWRRRRDRPESPIAWCIRPQSRRRAADAGHEVSEPGAFAHASKTIAATRNLPFASGALRHSHHLNKAPRRRRHGHRWHIWVRSKKPRGVHNARQGRKAGWAEGGCARRSSRWRWAFFRG